MSEEFEAEMTDLLRYIVNRGRVSFTTLESYHNITKEHIEAAVKRGWLAMLVGHGRIGGYDCQITNKAREAASTLYRSITPNISAGDYIVASPEEYGKKYQQVLIILSHGTEEITTKLDGRDLKLSRSNVMHATYEECLNGCRNE